MNDSLVRAALVQVRKAFSKATVHACAPFKVEGCPWVYVEALGRLTPYFAFHHTSFFGINIKR